MHGQSMKKHCLESNSTGLASQAQRLYVCCKKGLGKARSMRPASKQQQNQQGCCNRLPWMQAQLILGILGTMVPPPKAGSPDGSSSYTWNLPPPFGCARSERPGFNRQCLTEATWLAGMLTQATNSSPPLSYSVRDTTSVAGPAMSVEGAQGAC